MKIKELEELLKNSNDKLSVFANRELLIQIEDFAIFILIRLVNENLTDKEKDKLLKFEHFRNLKPRSRSEIIKSIKDDDIKVKELLDEGLIYGFGEYAILDIILSLGDKFKFKILNNYKFLEKHGISSINKVAIIEKLDEASRITLLNDKDLIENKLKIDNYNKVNLIKELENENDKLKFMDLYELNEGYKIIVFETFSDESKKTGLLERKYDFNYWDIARIVSSMDLDFMQQFIKENKEYLDKNNVSVYEIMNNLPSEKQIEMLPKIEDMGLTIDEKRVIYVTLEIGIKKKIDTSKLIEEYRSAIGIEYSRSDHSIKIDYTKDLNIYSGLDKIIEINAMSILEEEKQKFIELCNICPNMRIKDNLNLGFSTPKEYIASEKWIDETIKGMNPEWTDLDKLAYIDNQVGKKISYSPDHDTEVFNGPNSRALWKIIDTGYGICNGIAQVELYMLSKIGIKAERVNGFEHTFLLVDIDSDTINFDHVKGKTLVDPTWNLAEHRYGIEPDNFCLSYEDIRKNDIAKSTGEDTKAHENDKLKKAKITIEASVMGRIFGNIGAADEYGNFPRHQLISKSREIDNQEMPDGEKIKKQLELLSNEHPGFASSYFETAHILKSLILKGKNLDYDRCVVNRVYDRQDEKKTPVLYVYAKVDGSDLFFYADKDTNKFIQMDQKEFEFKFECYKKDLEVSDGIRPWEEQEIDKPKEETKPERKIAAKGEAR